MTQVTVNIMDGRSASIRSGKLAAGVLTMHLAIGGSPAFGMELDLSPRAEGRPWSAPSAHYQSLEEVASLDVCGFFLLKPMQVWVEQIDEGDFVASFPEARVSASGDTHGGAIEMLKDMVIGRLEHLSAIDVRDLGPGPLRQLSVLRSYIQERA